MDNITIGLLESQIEGMKNAPSVVEENNIILATVKMLLEKIDFSDETLKTYDERELKRMFLGFCKSANATCEFYDSVKDYLNPEIVKEEKQKELADTTARIKDITALAEEDERIEAELLSKKDELEKCKAEYDALIKTIGELKEIEKTANREIIAQMETEKARIEQETAECKYIISALDGEISELKQNFESVNDIIVNLNSEKNIIEANILDKVNENYVAIKQIFESRKLDLDRIEKEISEYCTEFEKLEERIKKSDSLLKEFELHLGENSEIVAAMRTSGLTSIKELNEHIDTIKQSIQQNLKQYDNMIGSVTAAEEKARDEVKRLQNKRV